MDWRLHLHEKRKQTMEKVALTDDARRVNTNVEDALDLCARGAVKVDSKRRESAKDHWVWVALDGIEGVDVGEKAFKLELLAVNIAKVDEEEGLLLFHHLRLDDCTERGKDVVVAVARDGNALDISVERR